MPRPAYAHCRACGKHRSEVGFMSWSRLCQKCAVETVTDNVIGLATMSGYPLERWRRGMAASVGAVLLDDIDRTE